MSPAAPAERAYDAVVLGAGPAGATAAYGLARAGHRVLLAEKQPWPRPKVCGCCLNAHALNTLKTAGLAEAVAAAGARPVRSLTLRAGRRCARLRLPAGVSISRPALDGALVDAAAAAGAEFRSGRAARLEPAPPSGRDASPRRHRVQVGDTQVSARVVVAADGLSGTALTRWPQLRPDTRPDARVGLGVHLPPHHPLGRHVPEHSILMLCGRAGYLGVVRLEDGTLDLAAAADRAAIKHHRGPGGLARAVAADAGLTLNGPDHDPAAWPWRITPPLTRSRPRVAAPGLLVVGDAAGYVEPFTGEGMAWALAGGLAAVPHAQQMIAGWRDPQPAAWGQALRRRVARRQRGCRAVAALLRRPRLTRVAVAALAVAPALARPLVPAASAAPGPGPSASPPRGASA